MTRPETVDVFISHASEDKSDFVRPLAEVLTGTGVSVWYDDFTLTVGDSLLRSIDRGLADSRYGIVVLSPSFLSKNWPEYELRGLVSRELEGNKVVLPIWHRITRTDLLKYSPSLADKLALDTSRASLQEIAFQLIRVIRPDLFSKLSRIFAWRKLVSESETVLVPASDLARGPIRHTTLPKSMLLRIKLVHMILEEVQRMSLDRMINNVRRDLAPEDEVRIWENIAAAYLEATRHKELDLSEKHQILSELVSISLTSPDRSDLSRKLKNEKFRTLFEIYHSVIPDIPADEDG